MFEFRGLIASASKNENAGFATPQNKRALSQKTLFTDKPKMALGDLTKNSLDAFTPMKNETIEKSKQQQGLLLPSTPTIKSSSVFNETVKNSTPKSQRNEVMSHSIDELDIWSQKQLLNEDQFDFLFMSPPRTSPSPPVSPTPSSPEPPVSPPPMPRSPENFWDLISTVPVWDRQHEADDEFDLPPVDNSFLSDDCSL